MAGSRVTFLCHPGCSSNIKERESKKVFNLGGISSQDGRRKRQRKEGQNMRPIKKPRNQRRKMKVKEMLSCRLLRNPRTGYSRRMAKSKCAGCLWRSCGGGSRLTFLSVVWSTGRFLGQPTSLFTKRRSTGSCFSLRIGRLTVDWLAGQVCSSFTSGRLTMSLAAWPKGRPAATNGIACLSGTIDQQSVKEETGWLKDDQSAANMRLQNRSRSHDQHAAHRDNERSPHYQRHDLFHHPKLGTKRSTGWWEKGQGIKVQEKVSLNGPKENGRSQGINLSGKA